jgi:hypothetical protein
MDNKQGTEKEMQQKGQGALSAPEKGRGKELNSEQIFSKQSLEK